MSIDSVLAHPGVLGHERRQGKHEPSIIHAVVVSHEHDVPPVGHVEAEAQVTAETAGVHHREGRSMHSVQRARALEQPIVGARVKLEMRRGNQEQCGCIRGKSLAAATGPLQTSEKLIHFVEIVVGAPFVPDPQREEREQIHEVVVEGHRQDGTIGRLGASFIDHEVEHVDRDHVCVDDVSLAVPVVECVKTVTAGLSVVSGHEPIQLNLGRGGLPDVGPHAVAQPYQRVAKVLRL